MSMVEIHQFLERLHNLIRSQNRRSHEGFDLQPVHLNALYYFSVCNKYSDTLLALAEYLGQTRGTTSQTLKLLEERQLIQKQQDTVDRRITHLKLSPAGRKILRQYWPSPVLKMAEAEFSSKDLNILEEKLKALLTACQRGNQQKSFAVCKTCVHNERRGSAYFCQLTQEPLKPSEVNQICREHEFPESGRPSPSATR